MLAFPITFMNESGQAVSALVRRYKIDEPGKIIVVHDELDLEPGVLKLKAGGGLAGHNGLRSITQHLKTQDYLRVRIGVGKPPSQGPRRRPCAGSRARRAARAARHSRRRGRRCSRDDRRRRHRVRDADSSMSSADVDGRRDVGTAPLRALPPLLRDEPGITRALGEPNARLADRRRSRGRSRSPRLARSSNRTPLVIACPTGTMAGQLCDDLRSSSDATQVGAVPGLGDAAVRAGQPERRDDGPAPRVLWRLRDPERVPGDHRRPACGRCCRSSARAPPTIEPIVVRPGAVIDPDELSAHARRVRATAARNWSSTAASSPGAARSSTSSRRPPTRRSASTCGATRSTG